MKTILLIVSLLSCFGFTKTTYKINNSDNDSLSNIIGHWCYVKKDSIDFDVTIISKKDSIFCTYATIIGKGSNLDAPDDENDWAFAIPKRQFSANKYISMNNFFNICPGAWLKLTYDSKRKVLIWITKPKDVNNPPWYLPEYIELVRCK